MSDMDRDPNTPRTDRVNTPPTDSERVTVVDSNGGAGWWIAGLLVLAVLIIGFLALSGGEPAPVESTAPTTEQAPAPAVEDTAPVEPAPVEEEPAAEPAPAETAPEAAPAEEAPATEAEGAEEAAPAQ